MHFLCYEFFKSNSLILKNSFQSMNEAFHMNLLKATIIFFNLSKQAQLLTPFRADERFLQFGFSPLSFFLSPFFIGKNLGFDATLFYFTFPPPPSVLVICSLFVDYNFIQVKQVNFQQSVLFSPVLLLLYCMHPYCY